jgi:AcrR family transcriptional regulator
MATARRREAISKPADRAPLARPHRRSSRASKPEKNGGRRDEILRIAARQFAEFGFEATTMRAIAEEAEILSGSIYHHFETKEEILHEIIREPIRSRRESTIRVANLDFDAERRLIALILLSFGELITDQAAHSILYKERGLFRRKREFDYVSDKKRDIYFAWRTVLKQGVDAGLFKPSIDAFLTYVTINRMLNTSAEWFKQDAQQDFRPYTLRKGESGAYSLDQLIDFSLDFILSAIRNADRISKPIRRQDAEALLA